jgi:hypothetical protein
MGAILEKRYQAISGLYEKVKKVKADVAAVLARTTQLREWQ